MAQARWRPVEVAAPAQSLFLSRPPWRDKRIRCSGRFTRTGRTGSTLRSSPAASRKSQTFSTLSVSGRAGEAGRREASEAAGGGEERRAAPATRFLFGCPPAPVPSPRASLGRFRGSSLPVAMPHLRSSARPLPSLVGPSIIRPGLRGASLPGSTWQAVRSRVTVTVALTVERYSCSLSFSFRKKSEPPLMSCLLLLPFNHSRQVHPSLARFGASAEGCKGWGPFGPWEWLF